MSNNILLSNDISKLLDQRESLWNDFDKVKNDISELNKYCKNCDWTEANEEFPHLKYIGMPSDIIPHYKKIDEYGYSIVTCQKNIQKSMTDIQQYEKDINDIKQTKNMIIAGIIILIVVVTFVVIQYL